MRSIKAMVRAKTWLCPVCLELNSLILHWGCVTNTNHLPLGKKGLLLYLVDNIWWNCIKGFYNLVFAQQYNDRNVVCSSLFVGAVFFIRCPKILRAKKHLETNVKALGMGKMCNTSLIQWCDLYMSTCYSVALRGCKPSARACVRGCVNRSHPAPQHRQSTPIRMGSFPPQKYICVY